MGPLEKAQHLEQDQTVLCRHGTSPEKENLASRRPYENHKNRSHEREYSSVRIDCKRDADLKGERNFIPIETGQKIYNNGSY